ncbi:hypothetical protein J7413_12435 [Shimia sp. R10_1]|uniref:hypothetical protein n=1 Tax=Shimia sp. R10_1 TaxID=2821095 RepID=UPI001ADC62A6|nr:hypothetical protein [Shimia sp. R10_1]MBO9474351.1 hypothetical protein [Shimia sp. R10_1]
MKKRDFIVAILAMPTLALAHEGHGALQVSTSVEVIKRRKDTVHLRLTLLNKGAEPVVLETAQVKGANVLTANWANVPSGALVDIPMSLKFETQVPSVFSLDLNFGHAGHDTVVVRL